MLEAYSSNHPPVPKSGARSSAGYERSPEFCEHFLLHTLIPSFHLLPTLYTTHIPRHLSLITFLILTCHRLAWHK